MTALQDWLTDRPMYPRTLRALICGTFRGQTTQPAEHESSSAEPKLLRPGLERC